MRDQSIQRLFKKGELSATPWKNGGGLTREIATSLAGNPYWRMSIASVDQNGAFSPFAGLCRILTVIQGNGMVLKGSQQTHNARPHQPISFDGAQCIDGHLLDGPVENFNLIYDAQLLDAQVIAGSVADDLTRAEFADGDVAMIYCVAGAIRSASFGELQAHAGAFVTNPADFEAVSESTIGLWIRLREIR